MADYRYIIDNGGITTPGNTRRTLVLITGDHYNRLPDGTRLYDSFGNEHVKGVSSTVAIGSFPGDNTMLVGFLATEEDLRQGHEAFFAPYRER